MPATTAADPATSIEQNEKENGIHPLYPTADGRPPKQQGVQPLDKPQKKPSKGDKFAGPFAPLGGDQSHTKYEFNNYDDDEDVNVRPPHRPINPSVQQHGGPGPGFFNPSVSKNQYPDYDQAIFHNGQIIPNQQHPGAVGPGPQGKPPPFNPFLGNGGGGINNVAGAGNNDQDKLSPDLFANILGANAQNIPPHLRIEHLLQQIQGGADGGIGGDGQHPFGGPPQGSFPFGQQHLQGQPGQRPPPPGISMSISIYEVWLGPCVSEIRCTGSLLPAQCI